MNIDSLGFGPSEREVAVVERWELWCRQGKTDEILADAAELFGPHLSDGDYCDLVFGLAVEHGGQCVANLMVHMGVDVNDHDKDGGFTALYQAITAQKPHDDMVEWLLAKGADPNGYVVNGLRPLHLAVDRDYPGAINILAAHGADLNATDLDHGYSPMELAAHLGRVDLVKQLLRLGARVNLNRLEGLASPRAREAIVKLVTTMRSN